MKALSINNTSDYEAVLAEIDRLFDAPENTPESDRLDMLVSLVEAYESVHYPIEKPDPDEEIRHLIESQIPSP